MVITDVNQVVYQGDGVNTAWPYTFPIDEPSNIRVMIVAADGTKTEVTSDFYIDHINSTVYYPGYAPGAEPVDQPPVLTSDERIVIYRQIPITQEKDLGDKWPFASIEKALDKLTMILQGLREYIPTKLSELTNDVGYVEASDLSTVATTGDYDDLSNKPTIPTVPTDISAFTNDVGYITGVDWDDVADKPTFATVATSGSYNDLSNKPAIPVVPTDISAFANDAGYITSSGSITGNAATATTASGLTHTLTINSTPFDGTADVDVTVGGGSYTAGDGIDISNDVISLDVASANDIGGVKVGTNLSVDANGVMSATDTTYTAGTNVSISAGNVISATDTKYTGSNGITLTGTNFTNSGVRSISEGSTNGTISVNTGGNSAEVAVHGLGNNAFSDTSYLPLAGGTMTGNIIFNIQDCRIRKQDNNGALSMYGGIGWNTSPSLALYGSGNTNNPGCFDLSAHDGTTRKQFIGKPDGTLTWGGKNIEYVKSSGTNYIRYANGLQICWTTVRLTPSSLSQDWVYPVAFSAVPCISLSQNSPINTYYNGISATQVSVKASAFTVDFLTVSVMAIGRWK